MRPVAAFVSVRPGDAQSQWLSGVSASIGNPVRWLAPFLAVLLVLFPKSAVAEQTVAVALSYDAPSDCPSKARFIQRLRMHTQRLVLSGAHDALRLQVTVQQGEASYRGRLDVARSGQPIGSREFNDPECREVVSALALSAALSIDPQATLSVPDSASDEADNTTVGAEPDDPEVDATGRSVPLDGSEPTRAAASAPGHRADVAEVLPAQPLDNTKTHLWSLGPLVAASFSFDPKAALGLGLFASVRDLLPRTLFPLEVAFHVDYLSTRSTRGSDPLALDWFQAAVRYCPLRSGKSLTLLLCSTMQGGWIVAQGRELMRTERATRSFFAAGLGLQGRATLNPSWELSAMGDITVPFVERRFATDPGSVEVSSSRPVGVTLALGAHFGF